MPGMSDQKDRCLMLLLDPLTDLAAAHEELKCFKDGKQPLVQVCGLWQVPRSF